MAGSGTDAAFLARQEDDNLTEIARITPGNPSKAREALVNENLPPALMAAFEAAANSATYTEKLAVFNQQQQDKTVAQQQQDEEKKEHDSQEAWLNSMSPEYRQAYNDLMTTVDDADKEYDRMREGLAQRKAALDEQAQEIDDHALHLSDGNRAYVDAQGRLVDKNGVPLEGQEATEAKALAQQHNGPISTVAGYQQNVQLHADVNALSQRVDTEQNEANRYIQDANASHKDSDTSKLQQEKTEAKQRVKNTRELDVAQAQQFAKTNVVSMGDVADLDGGDPTPASPADHTSYAGKVDPNAGIKANGLTAPFNAAMLGTPARVSAPLPSQKPAVGLPAPT